MRIEEQLRNLAGEMEDAQVPVSVGEIVPDAFTPGGTAVDSAGRPRSGWLAMAAATALVLAGVGGLVWWAGDGPVPVEPVDTGVPGTSVPTTSTIAPSTRITDAAVPVDMTPTLDYRPDGEWFIPTVIPDGFEFRFAVRQDVSGVGDVQDIYYGRVDCSPSGGCPELRVGLRTDIDPASLGTPESSWKEVDGAEGVFAIGRERGSVIRREGNDVAGISDGNLSFDELVEVARSTQLRPESELPRPPFICCRTLVEEDRNPGPVVADFTLDTDDGEKTWVMTAHTDGRFISLGGYVIGEDTFGPAFEAPIDPPATVSTRPGRLVGPALPAGFDLAVGITRRDVAAVELKLPGNRTIKIPTTELSGRFDARFIFAPIEVGDDAQPSAAGIPIIGLTALDANDNIIESD